PTGSGARTEVLKEQQPPGVAVSSPPTRDREPGLCHRPSCAARFLSLSPRASPRSHSRLHPPSPSSAPEKSLVAPQDPEHSLTEYIHRLEAIQQRLRGVQPGKSHLLTPHSSCKA
ncbi:PCNT protein, partial [Alaudala cheleensis]|nr:PCNT protein [Alaudala cheleensis]